MNKKIQVADLPTFDPTEHLKDDAEIAAYLSLVIDEGVSEEQVQVLLNRTAVEIQDEYCSKDEYQFKG